MYLLNATSFRRGGLALMITLTAMSAPTASITWTNTAGGNWNTAQNWTPNQVPGGAPIRFRFPREGSTSSLMQQGPPAD